jgi:hypothetical protein
VADRLLRDIDALKLYKAGREEGMKFGAHGAVLAGEKLKPKKRWVSQAPSNVKLDVCQEVLIYQPSNLLVP